MVYTHVARKGPAGVTSPLDLLCGVTDDDLRAAAEASRVVTRGTLPGQAVRTGG